MIAIVLLAWAVPVFAANVTATWDPNPETNIAGYKLSYGTQSGVYTTTIDVGNVTSWALSLTPGQYFLAVQAYDTDGLLSAYSMEVPFTLSSSIPAISSVTPASGVIGTSVVIGGSGFGASPGNSTVSFNGVNAPLLAWSDTSISVAVPAGAMTGNVVVTVGGAASNGVAFMVVPAATITSLSPTSGAAGATVTITGANFGATQGTSTLNFNGVAATPTFWSATSIVTTVPSGATTGNVTATVGGVVSNGVAFTVTPTATISSLSPSSGVVGTGVTITGTNFGATQGGSTVKFNGVTAVPTSWSSTSIVTPVPNGAATGGVVVTVGGMPSNAVTFTVTGSPTITSLSPTSGPVGATVTITGTNFGATQRTSVVMFNGVTTTPMSWSATSIVVTVPNGAATGNVTVTVGGVTSSGVNFTVTGSPAITSLSPASGAIGTTVTITGTGFGATQSGSMVSFSGILAWITSWSPTSIVTSVPAGATTGSVKVTVGVVQSNAVTFTVTTPPAITSLSPATGTEGTAVTITGSNFGATRGSSVVSFNGVVAVPTAWSATSITVPVPTGAATGNVVVTVGGAASNGAPFSVLLRPTITGLSQALGPVGTKVTITGTNFGATQGGSTVSFNGILAWITSWSTTTIVTTVPGGATTGNLKVTVGILDSNPVLFTVGDPPAISSLSPTSGAAGTTVTITGTNFGSTQSNGTVTFNGVTARSTSWSAMSIVTEVPNGALTGGVVVTVSGAASNAVAFTVLPAAVGSTPAITALSPARAAVGATVTITGTSFGTLQGSSTVSFNGVAATPTAWSNTSITVSVPSGATTGTIIVTVGAMASNGVTFTVLSQDLPTMTVDRTVLNFGALNVGASFAVWTPAQTISLRQSGATNTVTWTAVSNAPWLTVSPTSGSGPAMLSIAVQHVSTLPPAGSASLTGAVTITYSGAATTASSVNVRLNLPAVPAPASGVIDTPVAGATGLQGSIAVTGWAIDDIAVDRVELWRDLQPGETTPPFASPGLDPRNGKVFIGNATLVTDARPEIEALYPTTPLQYRAGWGYLLLTWGLWNQGNGTYTLHAFAFDAEGHVSTLGQKTIGVANASANRPFGSIDTPAIGAVASGTVTNFGWALTPNSGSTTCRVPATGVQVSIDSGPLQPVTFGDVRSDIAGAFAGFTNSAAAGGHFGFDTTALANGVHTIGWLITDDCNRADGVGSRFFTVQNTAAAPLMAAVASAPMASLSGIRIASPDPVVVAHGFGELGTTVYPDANGRRGIAVHEGERIEVRLPAGYDVAWQIMLGEPRALPTGATWDSASRIFAWQPAPGFLGDYQIVFAHGDEIVCILLGVVAGSR